MTHDVAQLVAHRAGETPDRIALVDEAGRTRTWQQLEDEVTRLASGLGEVGLVAGHRAMLVLGNRVEFVSAYLGVLRAQVVAVPVNPGSTPDELARMIADSGSRLVVADDATVPAVRAALDQLTETRPRVVVAGDPDGARGETSYAALCGVEPRSIPPLPDPEKLAALLYTSGTSRRPRAAMLTHRALLANVEQMARVEPAMIRSDDVVLGVMPLFHVYGLNAVLGSVLSHGARLVLMQRWEPEAALEAVQREGCTVLPVAPPVFAQLLAVPDLGDRLATVRLVISGSAPLEGSTLTEFARVSGVPVHQGYGLTEAAPVVTSTLCSADPDPGSVGAALPGIELRLRDEAGDQPGAADPGEIEVRGANLFSGYWPDGADGPDDEGWWATGDVGLIDDDGDLVLVDRVRELVIVSGFNVYPTEVEDVLREVDGVSDAAVIGVPDEETGEAVVAYVVADGDAAAVAGRVEEHVATRLARFKRPARIEVVDDLPQTPTGKVQKGRLRGLERRRHAGLLE